MAYEVSQQLHSVMASAKQFLTTAIADNRTQMAAINDVTERTEAGVDPKLLIESLMSELAKATTRATKLEVSFVEKSRELATIRDSLVKSEERAKTDTLTGLPNRRALEEFFRKAQLAAMEQDDPLSALLIDIDHFKRFNDEFGHGVGDQVLRLMAKVLREARAGHRSAGAIWRRGADRHPAQRRPGDGCQRLRNASGVRLRNATSPAARPAKRCPASPSRSAWRSSRAANRWPI